MSFLKRFALPLFGLFVGSIMFFPWNDVRDLISTEIQKASGVQIQMQSFQPTTGLRLGLSKGSLIAFSADKSTIRLPSGQMISCHELIVGPRIWPLFLAKVQLSLGCSTEDGGQMSALVSAAPFWNPQSASASVDLQKFNLDSVDLKSAFHGILSGSLNVDGINVQGGGGIPNINWNLSGNGVRTPEAKIPLLNLPSLELGNVETDGAVSANSIKVNNLNFGSSQSLIEGKIAFNSDVSENFVPTTGEISGSLRVDPNAEKGSLKDVPWKTFGTANEQGQREFKRPFSGGIQNLFFSLPAP